jgi:hypothetical protein
VAVVVVIKVVQEELVVLVAVVLEISLVEVDSAIKDLVEDFQIILVVIHILVVVEVVPLKLARALIVEVVMEEMDIKLLLLDQLLEQQMSVH